LRDVIDFRMAGPTRQARGRGHGSSRWSA
jgi:hypothetical protein